VLWHTGGIVTPVERQIFLLASDTVSKVRIGPVQGSLKLLAVGIKKKFVMVETLALLWSIRTVNTISIQLSRTHLRQVAMPDHIGLLRKWNTKRLPFSRHVEKAKLNFFSMLRIQRKVYALAIPG